MPITMEDINREDRAERRVIYIDYSTKRHNTKTMEPISKEEADSFERITRSTQFKDQKGDTVIRYETDNEVKKELRNSLWKTTSTLVNNNVKTALKNTTSLHGGFWCRFKKNSPIFMSRDGKRILSYANSTRFPSFFHNTLNRRVFELVDWWFERINSDLYGSYCSLKTPTERLVCKSYLMCVINFELSGPHYDKMDEIEGLCCVIPFGRPDSDWTGGDLVFRDLKLRFPMKPGDIIFFRSRELLHENLPAEGERRSLVFTTDHNSFLSPGQTVTRIYKNFSHLNVCPDWDEIDENEMDEMELENCL